MEYITIDDGSDLSTFDFSSILYIDPIQPGDNDVEWGFSIYTKQGGHLFIYCMTGFKLLNETDQEKFEKSKKYAGEARNYFINEVKKLK